MTALESTDSTTLAESAPQGSASVPEPADVHADGVFRCSVEELPELWEYQQGLLGDGSPPVDPARSEWLLERNPSCDEAGPEIWIARRDGSIVGTVSAIPFELKIGDGWRRTHWAIDMTVRPDWRGKGVAGQLTRARRGTLGLTCGLGVSPDGIRHGNRSSMSFVGTVPKFIHFIDTRSVFDGVTAARPWLKPASPLVRLVGATGSRLAQRRGRTTTVLPIERFDERVDAIWEGASPHYSVVSRRDARWLRWRFDESPRAAEYARYYVLRDGRPVGYFVLRTEEWRGLPGYTIVDYLGAPGDLAPVFAHAVTVARELGGKVLVCQTLNAHANGRLHATAFWRLRKASKTAQLTMHVVDDDPSRALVTHLANWFLTRADSDLDA